MDTAANAIDEALSGQQAIDFISKDVEEHNFEECSYSLILMDCNMPHMDGYECTHQIRQFLHLHRIKQPLIAAVTGHIEP